MYMNFLFTILVLYVLIRTIAYGIYCVKNTGVIAGISVFFLAAASVAAGYILIFANDMT